MMVETMLESSQDFGCMSSATSLPQWKRELLQRRAARSRPAPSAPAPPAAHPPPAPSAPSAPTPPAPPVGGEEDEELRYGPGIVKRLKSRYLSLALRDAPRRRPSVLRRAASLEHLLDERPPPAPRPAARAPRPASTASAVAPVPARRDFVKRARSVDALSRLEARDDVPATPPLPPPSTPPPSAPPPPPPAPQPPRPASARPPRRPAPLLRDTERPPPDLVRSTLRKFEPAPVWRAAPAARVSAALRGLERERERPAGAGAGEPRSPSPGRAGPGPGEAERAAGTGTPRAVSRAALEGIARAGLSTRYAFEAPRHGSHLPPLAAANPVLLGRARRVGVIRPMPQPPAPLERALSSPAPALQEIFDKLEESPRLADVNQQTAEEVAPLSPAPPTPPEPEPASPRGERREPPSALVEPIPRSPPEEAPPPLPRSPPPAPALTPSLPIAKPELKPEPSPKPKLLNGHGHANPPRARTRSPDMKPKEPIASADTKLKEPGRTEPADTEKHWNGVTLKKTPLITECSNGSPVLKAKAAAAGHAESPTNGSPVLRTRGSGARGGGARGARAAGGAAPASVVFNFSHRKEVPDYIENDGLILRASRRDRHRLKAGEPGVVVLNPELVAGAGGGDSDEGEGEAETDGPPEPCSVRFVNDNVLMNGRSSMPGRPNRDRIARLKLQFDDSLTRTFEYPSETSLCEDDINLSLSPTPAPCAPLLSLTACDSLDSAPAPAPPADAPAAALSANTHISSAALGRYTPHKTCADAFHLGVTRRATHATHAEPGASESESSPNGSAGVTAAGGEAGGGGDARPCGADARSWSDARALATDLLF